MRELPSGTVTFLFTDIAGSTALWERDRQAMAAAVDRQLAILQSLITAHHGVLYKTIGDGTQTAFASAEEALRAALASQRALLAEAWADPPGALRVRMALHAGEAIPDTRGDYLAEPLNRLALLLSTGYGGQVLLSQAVQQLSRGALPAGAELRDLGEHRLRDLLEPEHVFQLLHPALLTDFPPLRSLDASPNNLPRQPTPFIGREHQVAEIADLLRCDDIQLLTLVGPGGTGKTRLALHAAAELLDDFADGVYFVPLAPLTDAALVPSAIASALEMRDEAYRSLPDRLQEVLAGQQLLLVLDNVEHLIAAAPLIGELLSAAPRLKVLATSRTPLRLRAEREYPVPPLGLPPRQPPPPLEELAQYEAVRLFIERAQAVKPDFALDDETAPAVAEICWRLDGLPLAIELAAARVRLLPPHAMLARLEQRLPLLTGGPRDAPARHRTLRDTIAWSYDLLDPDEQMLFRRLAVFAGGCTMEAAEVVGNHDGTLDALAGVERLSEQSMLRQEEGSRGEPRFAMLETIREFGLEQLAASGEDSAIRDAHAAAMMALAEAAAPNLEGPEQRAWSTRLEADYANLREAFRWLRSQRWVEDILRLGARIKWFLCLFHAAEAGVWVEDALAQGRDVPWPLRADGLSAAGHLRRFQGDVRGAVSFHEEELALRRRSGDDAGLGRVLLALGLEAIELGEPSASNEYLVEALARLRANEDRWGVGMLLAVLGEQSRAVGDFEAAAQHYDESVRMHRSIGDLYHVVLNLSTLALTVVRLGDLRQAQEHALTAVATAQEGGLDHALVVALAALAEVAVARADFDTAEGLMQRALELAQAIGDEASAAAIMAYLASLHHRRGDDRSATDHLRLALELTLRTNDWRQAATSLEAAAAIAAGRGMAEIAARLFGAAANADPGIAINRYPSEESAHEQATEVARARLGEQAFITTYEAGRKFSLREAVAEALALVDVLAASAQTVHDAG